MSKELGHQLGGNIAKKMVKEASKLLKTTEKWVIGSLTSSSILFWVGVVALLVFVVWKPWEHLTFEQLENEKEDKEDEAVKAEDKLVNSLALYAVLAVFVVLVLLVLSYATGISPLKFFQIKAE